MCIYVCIYEHIYTYVFIYVCTHTPTRTYDVYNWLYSNVFICWPGWPCWLAYNLKVTNGAYRQNTEENIVCGQSASLRTTRTWWRTCSTGRGTVRTAWCSQNALKSTRCSKIHRWEERARTLRGLAGERLERVTQCSRRIQVADQMSVFDSWPARWDRTTCWGERRHRRWTKETKRLCWRWVCFSHRAAAFNTSLWHSQRYRQHRRLCGLDTVGCLCSVSVFTFSSLNVRKIGYSLLAKA